MKALPSKSICSLLTQAARLHRARAAQLLEKIGVFPGQDAVLDALFHHGSLTIGRLAELVQVRAPTISKAVTRLSSAGLLERHEGENRRRVEIVLTRKGRTVARKSIALAARIEKEMIADFNGRDCRRLRKLLKRIEENLRETGNFDVDKGAEAEA